MSLSVCLSVSLSVSLSLCLCLSVYLSVSLSHTHTHARTHARTHAHTQSKQEMEKPKSASPEIVLTASDYLLTFTRRIDIHRFFFGTEAAVSIFTPLPGPSTQRWSLWHWLVAMVTRAIKINFFRLNRVVDWLATFGMIDSSRWLFYAVNATVGFFGTSCRLIVPSLIGLLASLDIKQQNLTSDSRCYFNDDNC